MNPLPNFLSKAGKAVEHFREVLSQLRAGRATPALLEHLEVECYGGNFPLVQLATITTPGPKSLLVQPFDPHLIKLIEQTILKSPLGITPTNEGPHLRLVIPPLTEEKRKELLKILHEKSEECRIAIRNIRDTILRDLKDQEKEKTISEDEYFHAKQNVEKQMEKIMNEIREIAAKKEEEMLTI